MNIDSLRILLVDNDPANRCLFQVARAEVGAFQCEVAHADRLEGALHRAKEEPYDVILVDFHSSAALLVRTLTQLRSRLPGVPILLLSEESPATCASAAGEVERRNACKPGNKADALGRVIRYAVERNRLKESLPRWAFLDDLTGLYNRRGFYLLAEQQLRQARRSKRGLLLLYVDLDGLKAINDTYGHREGDLALRRTAGVLCMTFRSADVLGRLGGDEFGVLTWEDSGLSAEAVVTRLRQRVQASNASSRCQHSLSLSIGVARFDPTQAMSLERLIANADGSLYGQKRSKRVPQDHPAPVTPPAPVPVGTSVLHGTKIRHADLGFGSGPLTARQ